jgi:hypothetical protein
MQPHDQIRRLEAQVRGLRRYTLLSTGAVLLLVVAAFTSGQRSSAADGPARFTEIEVERINVVEADGRIALVLANAARLPGPVIRGREYPPDISGGRVEASGILFFNHEGTEAGGLTYGSLPVQDGVAAGGSLTLDRMNQDQVVQIAYQETGGRVFSGLQVWDRPSRHIQGLLDAVLAQRRGEIEHEEFLARAMPELEGTAPRVRLGSARRTALLDLNDTQGRTRIRILVDSLDVPRIEFRDERGRIVLRLPED